MKRMTKFSVIILPIILAVFLAACGGGDSAPETSAPAPEPTEEIQVSVGDAAAGEAEYAKLCIACHGPGGEGVEGLGKPFTTSEFLKSKTDAEMVEFVKEGRPISDPLNTTGVDMPPKGGNPALSDEDILNIIAFVRTLN